MEDAQVNVGITYLKFVVNYLKMGKMLDLFGNEFLYMEKFGKCSFKDIYIFNPRMMCVRRTLPQEEKVSHLHLRDTIGEFFGIDCNGCQLEMVKTLRKKYSIKLYKVVIAFMNSLNKEINIEKL